jgi:hypothetical protein
MREEEQRGSAPEPYPAGLRASPPRFPPAPPTLDDGASGGGDAVPESVEELLRAFHGCVREAGSLRERLAQPETAGLDPDTGPDAGAALRQRIAELRLRLLLGDADLSDPLLRIYQDQVLALAASNVPEQRGTLHLSVEFQARVIQKALRLAEATPAAWRQFPFSREQAMTQLMALPPRDFFRRVLDQMEAVVRDPSSYESVQQFDEAVAWRMVAGFTGALAVADWVREQNERGDQGSSEP